FLHLDNLIGDESVGLPVNRLCRLFARCLDEAEHLARPLVVPVAQVVHAVLVLNLEVLLMGATERLARQSLDFVVDVKIERHWGSSWGDTYGGRGRFCAV